jgi:hypothetical protein
MVMSSPNRDPGELFRLAVVPFRGSATSGRNKTKRIPVHLFLFPSSEFFSDYLIPSILVLRNTNSPRAYRRALAG